jgi:spermidine/putrescine-binding protein
MSDREMGNLIEDYVSGRMSRGQLIMRGLALGISLTSLDAILASSAAASEGVIDASTLNIIAWGGGYGDSLKKYVNDPFAKRYGTKIRVQEQSQAALSLPKLLARKGHPAVDVWLTTGALPYLLAKAGGLRSLTPTNVPNLRNIIPSALATYNRKTYGAGIHLSPATVVVDRSRIRSLIPNYNVSMLNSWKFLYRPELKNNISIPPFSGGYGAALVGLSKVYGGSEYNEAKFFAAMKKLAPNVHTIPTGIDVTQQFQTQEVIAATTSPPEAQLLVKSGLSVDIGYPADPIVNILDYIVAINNNPAGAELAFKYIDFLLQPRRMTKYDGSLGVNSPNRRSVQPKLANLPPVSITQLVKRGWQINFARAVANFDSWNQRFQEEIVPLFGK